MPSWPSLSWLGLISILEGKSPLDHAVGHASTPSEITPTFTPLPVNPLKARTKLAR